MDSSLLQRYLRAGIVGWAKRSVPNINLTRRSQTGGQYPAVNSRRKWTLLPLMFHARIGTRMIRAVEHDVRAHYFFFEGIWNSRRINSVRTLGIAD
jgi:hypothetical protein